jgi:NADPH-dependent ferric siderophore reductase
MEITTMATSPSLNIERVRHPLKFRLLEVKRVRRVTPHLASVTLTGPGLDDFVSASFDDHVKVFFPAPGADRPALPRQGPNGPVFSEDEPKPIARDFTPRRFDREARELDIEFVLHHAGPASQWAAAARPGQVLGVGGPRGSFVIPAGFDWHLLIGDDTAMPAIARRLEELPGGTIAHAIIEAPDASAAIEFKTRANSRVVWRFRDREPERSGEDALLRAVRDFVLPAGEGYVWAAGEAASIRPLRKHLCEQRGVDKSRIRAAAYWKRGQIAVHENIED